MSTLNKVIDASSEKVIVPKEIYIEGTRIILRHEGHWEKFREDNDPKNPEHMKCSNCGQYWAISEHEKIFKYCFNCGSKMDGETE